MIKIGLTGGIGSGKSVVAEILKNLGYQVFNSDEIARKILQNEKEVHQKIRAVFGNEIFADEIPSSEKIANIVFSQPEKLKSLNEIIHPKVAEAFTEFCKNTDEKIVFKEAAILIESGAYKEMDKMIVIEAPIEKRIERVLLRDKTDRESVEKRMKNQLNDEERNKFADFLIINDDHHALLPQINRILEELKKS